MLTRHVQLIQNFTATKILELLMKRNKSTQNKKLLSLQWHLQTLDRSKAHKKNSLIYIEFPFFVYLFFSFTSYLIGLSKRFFSGFKILLRNKHIVESILDRIEYCSTNDNWQMATNPSRCTLACMDAWIHDLKKKAHLICVGRWTIWQLIIDNNLLTTIYWQQITVAWQS